MMKTFVVTIVILLTLFIVGQAFVMRSSRKIEMHQYQVIKTYTDFEIRRYEAANFSYITMDVNTYKQSSGKAFRSLAGYIFGGNDENKSIAMTSPVTMSIEDSTTMMFMIPKEYQLDELPKPDNPNVKFKLVPEKVVAAIRFGGWTNDKKNNFYIDKLKNLLAEHRINHFNNFSYLGYNPPYEVINRRNEIIVEIDLTSINEI